MKRCQHCGEELPLEAAFCFKCGKQQAVKEVQPTKKEKKYFNEDHEKQAKLLADMGFLPSSFQPTKKKVKEQNKNQQQLNLDDTENIQTTHNGNNNFANKNHKTKNIPITEDTKNTQKVNKELEVQSKETLEHQKPVHVPTTSYEENKVEKTIIVEQDTPISQVDNNENKSQDNLSTNIENQQEIKTVGISPERQKILDELDEQFGMSSIENENNDITDDNNNIESNNNDDILIAEEPMIVVEESVPIEINEKQTVFADANKKKEDVVNSKISNEEQSSNKNIILSKLKSRRARHVDIVDDEEDSEDSFENVEYVDNSTASLLDDSTLTADEKADRKKETTSLLEKLLKKSNVSNSSLEDQTEGRKNKKRTRQTSASQLYDMEFDRTHIENDKDPEYDGYYESILPEDFGMKEKKSFDKSILLKVGAIIGVAIIAIYLMLTFMF